MWLPKKERELLAIYAERAESYGKACEISNDELIRTLGLESEEELFTLKSKLEFRGLLCLSTYERPKRVKHINGKPAGTEEYGEPQIFLNENSYNIGLKYGAILGKLELWTRENIWFWVVLSVVIGIIGILTTIIIAIIQD
ncbi:MAG: hypothetical protein JW837_10405 [Sedimentisphaerales bacterium]|nr:hypothetical protein [Sedimentisphaerales bacterium]